MLSTSTKFKFAKNFFEKKAWQDKFFVCGIDEAGRGSLAGPLVVAAVILPQNTCFYLLKDSKILTKKEREKAFRWIVKNCIYSCAIISPSVIDEINIYRATLLAMKRSFIQVVEILPFKYEFLKYLIIDAMPLKLDSVYKSRVLEIYNFPFGESLSSSIAAASIIAKVTRDRMMDEFHSIFPAFCFDCNKGYGTKKHVENITFKGASIVHRLSFIGNFLKVKKNDEYQQFIF